MSIRSSVILLVWLAVWSVQAQTGTFKGSVRGPKDAGLKDARVLVQSSAEKRWLATDDNGAFQFTDVKVGEFSVTVEKAGFDTRRFEKVSVADKSTTELDVTLCAGKCVAEAQWLQNWALGLAIFFVFAIVWVRWHKIALPARKLLLARVRDVQGRAAGLGDIVVSELERMAANLAGIDFIELLLWCRGTENEYYKRIHQIELQLLDDLAEERILAQLATTRNRLAQMESTTAISLAQRIDEEWKLTPPSLPKLRALLAEGQYFLYDAADAEFSEFTSWMNKAVWLSVVGLLIAVVLGVTAGRVNLLVLGAAGGFLSRLNQQVRRAKVSTDYGASWSMLFLSPVAGALSGWLGVLLIHMATVDVELLGKVFQIVHWDAACQPGTMGAAFLLGFSERLFDTLVKKLEDSIDKKGGPVGPQGPTQPTVGSAGASPVVPTFTLDPKVGLAGTVVKITVERMGTAVIDEVVLSAGGNKLPAIRPVDPKLNPFEITIPAGTPPGEYDLTPRAAGRDLAVIPKAFKVV